MSDDLDDMIAEFSREHPWLWRRTQVRSWFDRGLGRWLPRFCRHRTQLGSIDGPMTCMDCRKVVTDA